MYKAKYVSLFVLPEGSTISRIKREIRELRWYFNNKFELKLLKSIKLLKSRTFIRRYLKLSNRFPTATSLPNLDLLSQLSRETVKMHLRPSERQNKPHPQRKKKKTLTRWQQRQRSQELNKFTARRLSLSSLSPPAPPAVHILFLSYPPGTSPPHRAINHPDFGQRSRARAQ